MDATQMICDSVLESDEEADDANARAEPLATLRVLKNKHIPETVLPLYLGENVLGRDPSTCTVPLHAHSVSKQHTAVSISVFHASSRRDCASLEALVWDMGSMNGTRKGRLKLTPHVRYALSEGDRLMVADIPCQYASCLDPGSVVKRDTLAARESQVTGEDEEVRTKGNAEEATSASPAEPGETTRSPARPKALSFERTPTQPERSLVPESDSDSDGERGKKDRWRKTLVSESASLVTSPTCGTFLSPKNKIIPESEDESPITPSSSAKHGPMRCVRTDGDKQDLAARHQRLKSKNPVQFVATDSEEEEDTAAPVGPAGPEKEEGRAADQPQIDTRPNDGPDRPGPTPSAEPLQGLSMDSDTDVEGEEESSASAGPVTLDGTSPSLPPPSKAKEPAGRPGGFDGDSETDVDEEEEEEEEVEAVGGAPGPAPLDANATGSPSEVLLVRQADGDTDTDTDDKLDGVTIETRASPQSDSAPVSAQPSDFHLESDTDVEEEEEEEEEEGGEGAIAKTSPPETEGGGVEVASAATQNFGSDSDTDDEVQPADANSLPMSEGARTPPASAEDAAARLDILSNSDTDAEEDPPRIPPAAATATSSDPSFPSGPISLPAILGPDSDVDTDVDDVSASAPDTPDVSGTDSDTDVEDGEQAGARGPTGGQGSCSSDEKGFGAHGASLQQCSTPVAGGADADMETQEYPSPSIDPFKCPKVPAPRLAEFSSSISDSQGEDDFVVAETQSFIVDDLPQQASPSQNYTLDETQPFLPEGTSEHEDGLSESTRSQLQALEMESTQAFALSDSDVNMADTQVYSTTASTDRSSLELDWDPGATQSCLGSTGPGCSSAGSGIEGSPVDIALRATQAFLPESHSSQEEGVEDEGDITTAETQPMASSRYSLAMAETQLMCDLQEGGSEQVDGVETPAETASPCAPPSPAETHPTATSEVEGSEEEDRVTALCRRRARRLVEEEEDTQVTTGTESTAAQTQPRSSTSTDESQEEEDQRPSLKLMRSRRQRVRDGGTSARVSAVGAESAEDSDTAEEAEGRPARGRGRKTGPGPSRGVRGGEEEEKMAEPRASLRSTRSTGKTSSSTRGGTRVVEEEEEEEEEERHGDQVRHGSRRTTRPPRENAKEKKERLERERGEKEREQEERQRVERERREEEEERDRLERERLEMEEKERIERERKEHEEKERSERVQREKERKEHEEKERLERIQREKEEQQRLEVEERERQERERLEIEERTRAEREQKAREERERLEREAQERLAREKKEREERLEKEEQERRENKRRELEEKARTEQIQKEERERLQRERREQEERKERERAERERREQEERARLERERKESEEKQRLEKEEKQRLEKERLEKEEKERLEKERLKKEEKQRLEKERLEKEEKQRLEKEEKERLEKEEKQRLEKERLEKEEKQRLEKEEKERLEKEEKQRLEKEKKQRLEKERLEKEEKQRLEKEEKQRLEKERLEKEEKQRLEKEEKERLEKEEKQRLEKEEKQRLEKERLEKEEKQRLEKEEKERLEKEEKQRLEKERVEQEMEKLRRELADRQQKEAAEREEREQLRKKDQEEAEKRSREETDGPNDGSERLTKEVLEKPPPRRQRRQAEAQAPRDEQTPRTTRGRRATQTAAAASSAPGPEEDHGPATRTRSRSNSSNSVSSERSASSATAPDSTRRRGRGAQKNHPDPAAGPVNPTRESRRRTTQAESWPVRPSHGPGRDARSRSNSTDSLDSEVSARSSASNRGARGTGRGRGRGRGRKSLPAPEIRDSQPSSSAQNQVTSPPKASTRGRKTRSRGACEDEPDGLQPAATRGRRGSIAACPGPLDAEEQVDPPGDSTLGTRGTTGRGRGGRAQIKCEPAGTAVAVDGTEVDSNGATRALESGPNDDKPAPSRRGRGSRAQARRTATDAPVQEEAVKDEEEEQPIERKVRMGRPSVARKKKEVLAVGGDVMEPGTGTSQTPAGKSSRKRGAATAQVEVSPVAKSPRANSASPRGRLRAASQPHKVLFTGLVDEAGERAVVRLGGSLALGVADMTHLVTDKVRRTVKFLCAMGRGIPVVTTQWLEKSAKAGTFLSPAAFIVKDAEQERKFNFCLEESIRVASNQPLLQGYQIHVTKSVKPEPTHMLDIISCCGASFLSKMPSSPKGQTVVVSCEEDWLLCGPALAASLPVVSAEFLLTGILQQKADVEAHALPTPPAGASPGPQAAGARGRARKRT